MHSTTPAGDFLELSLRYPIIDVRSPGEFSRGHIPGANNVALLSDSERAAVGTTYKEHGRDSAISLGWQIVRPKLRHLVESVQTVAPTPHVLLHCWRGGMRSDRFAELLAENGFRPNTLEGGYKSFRRLAHRAFSYPRRIVILSGLSGCGKTHLLKMLRDRGEQVIDLEGLAHHRGSAFGGIGQPPQPTVEQFENDLFCEWRDLDPERVTWVESESQTIGSVAIPQPVWQQLMDAPAVHIEVGREERIRILMSDYAHLPDDELEIAVLKIKKRLGGARLKEALDALRRGDKHGFAEIVLDYYDKAYARSHGDHPRRNVTKLEISQICRSSNVSELVSAAEAISQRVDVLWSHVEANSRSALHDEV